MCFRYIYFFNVTFFALILSSALFRGPRPGGAHNVTRRTHDDNNEESKTSARFYVGLFPCRPISSDSL